MNARKPAPDWLLPFQDETWQHFKRRIRRIKREMAVKEAEQPVKWLFNCYPLTGDTNHD